MKSFFKKIITKPLWAFAAGAGIITFCLAIWIGSQQSVWFDEAFSLMLVHQPFGRMMHFISVDTHPPLYYLTLRVWIAMFGDGDIWLRSLSALFGSITAFTAIVLAARLFGKHVALFCVPIVILAPFLLRYDFEIRMYAMASMWCVVGTYLMVRGLQAPTSPQQKKYWALYAATVLAGALTFYYCVFVWLAHFLWLTARYRYRDAKDLTVPSDKNAGWFARQPWLLAYGTAIVVFLAWVPTMLSQIMKVQGNFWIGPVSYRSVVDIFTYMLDYRAEWDITPWQSIFIFGGLLVVIWLILAAYQHSSDRIRWYFGLLSLYLLVPIGLMYVLSLPPMQPVFLDRYATQAMLGGYLLTGAAIGLVWLERRHYLHKAASVWVILLLIFGTLRVIHLGNYFHFYNNYHPDVRTVANYVKTRARAGDIIVIDGANTYYELAHYLPTQQLRFTYNTPQIPTTGAFAMLHDNPYRVENAHQLATSRIWYIYPVTAKSPSLNMQPVYHAGTKESFTTQTVTLYYR